METQRPKVNDIVKIRPKNKRGIFWWYAKVVGIKDDGIDVLLPPCDELPTFFSFAAYCIGVVGREEPLEAER